MTTIFIAEDDNQLRRFYKTALESKGYQIIGMTGDGEEAISMFKNFNKRPDLIILDYRMPNKNGIQILKEILKIEKKSKIILASADEKIKLNSIIHGVNIFLAKPFSLDELYESVAKLANYKKEDKNPIIAEQTQI